MEEKKGFSKKLNAFFAGKGFYIVLFLCAAVIGVSAWMMAAGNKTMAEDVSDVNSARFENKRVETIIITPQPEAAASLEEPVEEEAPAVSTEGLAENAAAAAEETSQVWREGDVMEVAAPMYIWPVSGNVARSHDMETLYYDQTMGDWRTHEGIDIAAPLGTEVAAAHAGWRGTVNYIAGHTLDRMRALYGTDGKDVIACIGPGISLPSFEVGEEVYEAFRTNGFAMDYISEWKPETHKHHIDLWAANRMQLLDFGVPGEQIETSGICTYMRHDEFFSARRLGIKSGRILSGIMIVDTKP
mgnify:CR=1 FL=1